MQIIYMDKRNLYPKFGLCAADRSWIAVRNDLPACAQRFVLKHELFHVTDPTKNWILRELKANWHAFKKEPLGGIVTAVLSLAPYRLAYYFKRFRDGK